MAWNDRFKQASARTKARVAAEPLRFPDDLLAEIRRRSPEAYLRRRHADLVVERPGQSLSVPKVLRADLDTDHWVSCDWNEGPIGDNIALVMHLEGVGFVEAVQTLSGGREGADPRPVHLPGPPPPIVYPRLPATGSDARGRGYLRGRGISDGSILAAEAAGLVRYSDAGVLFLGRDGRSVRAATIRYFEATTWEGASLTKRDLANSDKSFPGILRGAAGHVVVAESGISGLAARDLLVARGLPAPTVVVSGGVNTRRWVTHNQAAREILGAASLVEIWAEREMGPDGPDAAKQLRTDASRLKLADAIAMVRDGELPAIVYPPEGIKDAAEWNLAGEEAAGPAHG